MCQAAEAVSGRKYFTRPDDLTRCWEICDGGRIRLWLDAVNCQSDSSFGATDSRHGKRRRSSCLLSAMRAELSAFALTLGQVFAILGNLRLGGQIPEAR